MKPEMTNYIICDIDGTLADTRHREYFMRESPKDWKGWNENMCYDGVYSHTLYTVLSLASSGIETVFCSGRGEEYRDVTEGWLKEVCSMHGYQYDLMMRPKLNSEKDHVIKRRMLETLRAERGHDPMLVIDDRPSVIEMWKEEGLNVFETNTDRWKPDFSKNLTKRSGLHIMVGVSGVGKTTWCEQQYDMRDVVSSDHIRDQILDDPKDMSKNGQVFDTLHSLVKHRLDMGLFTVVDATNLRNKDRKAIVALAQEGTSVTYVVLVRPLDKIKASGGWRNEVVLSRDWEGQTLVEAHYKLMENNLSDIVQGDDLDVNVRLYNL